MPDVTDVSPNVLQRTLNRERRARKAAESLLEEKSRELYDTHNELLTTAFDLHIEAERTRTILQTAAEAIITFDRDGTIETVNPAAERIFGYLSSEFVGTSVKELIVEGKRVTDDKQDTKPVEPIDENFWTSLPGTHNPTIEVAGKRKDGEEFVMELAGSRVEFEDRLIYTWILRDVTERRNLERQLSFSQRLESVGQLAAGIAHEINTPIQFVSDNLTFMQKAFQKWSKLFEHHEALHAACKENNTDAIAELCESIDEYAEEAQIDFLRSELPTAILQSCDGASRVAKIVRTMKEFSHPGVQSKTKTDINKAIESTLTVSRNEWKYVADVETDFAVNLPDIPCFPGDLNQAILNLIVNAAQAISEHPKENERGKITVRTRATETHVEISIEDNGPGMGKDVRDRIFDPFFTTKPVGKGTGQGLAITYSVVVERHDGTVHVESELGKGTTFVIRLPINQTTEN